MSGKSVVVQNLLWIIILIRALYIIHTVGMQNKQFGLNTGISAYHCEANHFLIHLLFPLSAHTDPVAAFIREEESRSWRDRENPKYYRRSISRETDSLTSKADVDEVQNLTFLNISFLLLLTPMSQRWINFPIDCNDLDLDAMTMTLMSPNISIRSIGHPSRNFYNLVEFKYSD